MTEPSIAIEVSPRKLKCPNCSSKDTAEAPEPSFHGNIWYCKNCTFIFEKREALTA
jgi:rubredoxin